MNLSTENHLLQRDKMNSRYEKLTAEAVKFENAKSYRQAAEAWRKAAQCARKPENITWCEQRAAYCDKVKR